MCGRHSLEVFCLGVFLSLMGGFVLIEISGTLAMQVGVSLGGIALMVGLAALMSWYKGLDRRVPKQPATQ
jgi:hypothetical protein